MKVVVLCSGGMDSVTALYWARREHEVLAAVSFNYGAKHNDREIPFAAEHAAQLRARHEIIALDFVNRLFASDLLKSGGEIPEGHYEAENMKQTVVPFRNAIMLSIACGFAESIGAEGLVIAAHGTDLNENSAVAAKREAGKIRELNRYAAVLNLYMEEAPLIADWKKLTASEHVVVVPFFISDGLHSYEDIPVMLGIAREGSMKGLGADAREELFRRNPYQVDQRLLYYASAIGTEPALADTIIKQVARFDGDGEGSVPGP